MKKLVLSARASTLEFMHPFRFVQALCIAALVFCARPVGAVSIFIDYSTDTSGFFSAGSQARATMEAAASFYSTILTDTLAAIQRPAMYRAPPPRNGTATFNWRLQYSHPATQLTTFVINPTIPANQYLVYVGARNLPDGTLGIGGPGGWTVDPPNTSGTLNGQDGAQINQIQQDFIDLVRTRGETSGFANWGGALTVDSSVNWHLNHNTAPAAGTNDLYSVLVHELGHVLGFGASGEWNDLVSGANFIGSQSMNQYGGAVPLSGGHWANGVSSTVLGGSAMQETAFDPSLNTGSRKRLTVLDAAGLVDIGWEIDLPDLVPGDYNRNGTVDAADYSIWRNTLGSTTDLRANGNNSGASAGKIDQADYVFWKSRFGNSAGSGGGAISVPEPGSVPLAVLAITFLLGRRSRR